MTLICFRLISFAEFQAFEGLLCVPDALYKTAFQLFDTNGNGMVAFGKVYHEEIVVSLFVMIYMYFIWLYIYCQSADEFVEVMRKTILHQKMPFNMDSNFIKLYFGKDKKRLISYAEFSQFLHVSILFYCMLDCGFVCYFCLGNKPSMT